MDTPTHLSSKEHSIVGPILGRPMYGNPPTSVFPLPTCSRGAGDVLGFLARRSEAQIGTPTRRACSVLWGGAAERVIIYIYISYIYIYMKRKRGRERERERGNPSDSITLWLCWNLHVDIQGTGAHPGARDTYTL